MTFCIRPSKLLPNSRTLKQQEAADFATKKKKKIACSGLIDVVVH
jgi:hypothetical protein